MLPQITSKTEDLGTLTKKRLVVPFNIREGFARGEFRFSLIEADHAAIDNGLASFARLPERSTFISVEDELGRGPDYGEDVKELTENLLDSWVIHFEHVSGEEITRDEFIFVREAILHELKRAGVDIDQSWGPKK